MSTKTIVCRCEDVTLDDVHHTMTLGYTTVEEVKRYTGFGTGPCQGKECLVLVARIIAARVGATQAVQPFTARPPLEGTALAVFAGLDEEPPR